MLRWEVCILLVVLVPTGVHGAITYEGTLASTSDNLGSVRGVGGWINPGPTTIQWWVTEYEDHWHYKYTVTVPEGESGLSHFVIGVSDAFEASDCRNASGPFTSTEIGDFDQSNGNPDIPATLHGLKFDDIGDCGEGEDDSCWAITIEFDSSRVAVWGDFYAKGGGNPNDQAWNAGLGVADPTDLPAAGSIDDHILVPDSATPEPATLALVLLGTGALFAARRR